MSRGHLRVERRLYDSTVDVNPDDEFLDQGELFRVVRATRIRRMSLLTRILDAITGGLFAPGKYARVDVVKEERGAER